MAVVVVCASVAAATKSDFRSFQKKAQQIESGKVPSGANLRFTAPEVNAYLQFKLLADVPPGVRALKAQLHSGNTATGSAMVDFIRLRSAQGKPPNWLIGKLLQGEHEVRVTARVDSGNGQATVIPLRVEVSGVPISGAALDFLVENYLIPNYPTAKVGRPFELKYGIERIDVSNGTAYVYVQ